MDRIHVDVNDLYEKVINYDFPDPEFLLSRWGDRLVSVGLEVLCTKLKEQFTRIFVDNIYPGGRMEDKVEIYISSGKLCLGYIGKLIERAGSTGHRRLVDLLKQKDHDIGALAAILLAGNVLNQIPAMEILLNEYNTAAGTGFKLAIAFALLERGSLDQIRSLSVPYLLPNSELLPHGKAVKEFESLISDLKKIKKQDNPYLDEKTIILSVYEYLAVKHIIDIVIEDIGSKGKICELKWPSSWVR